MTKDEPNPENYFWESDTDDLQKNVYGRYKHGESKGFASTVATIKKVVIDDEEVFHVKIVSWKLPYEFSFLEAAIEFVVAWFSPTIREGR